MLVPFLTNAWSVVPVKVDSALCLDLTDLEVTASKVPGPFVALVALYFGRLPDDRYRAAVRTVRERGGIVVDDETHRVLVPGRTGADIAVASLRKLLPVADGAYVRGLYANRIGAMALEASGHGRWRAMELKSDCLSGSESPAAVRELFSEVNGELEQSEKIFRPSARTVALVQNLDYEGLARARNENATLLQAELANARKLQVLNPIESVAVPSHVVVRGNDPLAAQARMAEQGLFCSMHWPKSNLLRSMTKWPRLGLSVPVDHRYGPTDMVLAARVIQEVWS